eukprot:4153688-Pyramimonas_sp.AAC.1
MGPLYPDGRSIVAGSSGATFEAKLALLHMIGDDMTLRPKDRTMLSFHVDNLSQRQWGPVTMEILKETRHHVRRIGHRLQKELCLPLAMHKLNMVTSSGQVMKLGRAALGAWGGPGERSIKNPGIDFTGGKHRAHRRHIARELEYEE